MGKGLKSKFYEIINNRYTKGIDITKNILSICGYLGRSKESNIVQFKKDITEISLVILCKSKVTLTESLFIMLYNVSSNPICKYEQCTKAVKFRNFIHGYSTYCSQKCVSLDTRDIVKQKSIEKYGCDYPFQSEVVKEKIKETNLKRYGVTNPAQNEEIYNKVKQTNLKRYDVEYIQQNPEIVLKRIKTNIERYGYKNASQSEEVKDKVRNTNLKKFGVNYPSQNKDILKIIQDKNRRTFYYKLMTSDRFKGGVIPEFKLEDFKGCLNYQTLYPFKCLKCNDVIYSHIISNHIPRCIKCYPYSYKSRKFGKTEKEIYDFCKQYFDDVIENDRNVLNGKEIDILIPSINLGIEFNGLYWHSELNGKDSKYHLNKTLLAKQKGVQLIHIFEDEWYNKQDIVKSILKSKMNKLNDKIYARKCIIREVNNEDGGLFLFNNHLQGSLNGKHLGLYYNDELVCMITMGKSRYDKSYEYEIYRFCNKLNISVIGGFSRLLSNFIRIYKPNSIITYVDLRYSDGYVYKNTGFSFSHKSRPNYFYIKNGRDRENRMNYRKNVLSSKLEDFDSNLSEWVNMQLNGYDRIWDCGNNVYVWGE